MIVKNEGKIIHRLLQSVVSIVDSYCICDTGSTDDTVSIIKSFFKKHNIPGKIIHEPFRDFGHNRSIALKACEGEPLADYILLLDADMVLWLNPQSTPAEFKRKFVDNVYLLFQGTEQFFYKNVRIVKNNIGASYWGVTHEYLSVPFNTPQLLIHKSDAFIIDIGDGGSKSNKYERDVQLLKQGLIDHPNNDRYTFYLANTYHDANKNEEAIDYYRKRIALGGWHEEIWYSHYRIGIAYGRMGKISDAIAAWMDAYEVFPNRVENLYKICQTYRLLSKHKLSYVFYQLAKKTIADHPTTDFLFMEKDVYDWKLDYEFTIIGYYTNPDNYPIRTRCMQVASHLSIDRNAMVNILSNYKFYSPRLNNSSDVNHNHALLQLIGKEYIADFPDFVSSTPSLALNSLGELVVNVRYVNYSIDANGNYINRDKIQSINVVAIVDIQSTTWRIKHQQTITYNTNHDDVYVGLEDIRLFSHGDKIYYNANRGLKDGRMVVEHGIIENDSCCDARFLRKNDQRPIEKNWVLCENADGAMHCVYEWYPLTVGTIGIDGEFATVASHQMPYFFKHVRGSTNGQIIGNEVWFLCHSVSYEDCRYYYHLFVVLDAATLAVKKYTPWFTFEKQKVEYSLGFVVLPGTERLLIGYSTMDRNTKHMEIEKSFINAMMILV